MKKLKNYIFLLLISIVIYNCSCSEDVPVLPPTPIANAGNDQLVEAFDTVYINGDMKNYSGNAEYIWTFDYKPEHSKSFFSDSSSPNPYFIPDVQGFYSIQLKVKVGNDYSSPDFALIHAINIKSNQYFPSTVGSKWLYKTTNSDNEVGTLNFEIVSEYPKTTGMQGTLWISDIKNNTSSFFYNMFDTLYYEDHNDTLIFKRNSGNNLETVVSYIVPFSVGNTWYDADAYYLVEEESNVGTFTNAYKIVEYRSWFSISLITYSWFVPYIGLVKRDIYQSEWQTQFNAEHWELISYYINDDN